MFWHPNAKHRWQPIQTWITSLKLVLFYQRHIIHVIYVSIHVIYVSIHVFMSQILSKQKLQDYEISYESNEYPQH